MAVNRYYTPSRSSYVSQFVPKELPADMMLRGLLAKQQKYDTTDASMGEAYATYNPNALEGRDTQYATEKKAFLKDFIDKSRNEDLASPEFQRRYRDFLSQFKEDPNMDKVTSAYNQHQAYLARKEEIRKKGKHAEDQAYFDEYERSYGIYTAKDGKGFEGDVQLHDPLIKEGNDIQKEIEELFNHVGADSFESLGALSGSDLYYSSTRGGVSVGKLNSAAAKQLNTFIEGPAGDQLKARFAANNIPPTLNGKPVTQQQYLSSLSKEDKQKYHEAEYDFIKKTVTGTGSTFATSTYSTNLGEIKNQQAGLDREFADEAVIMTGTFEAGTTDNPVMTWEDQLKSLGNDNYALDQKIAKVKSNPSLHAEGTLEGLLEQKKRINAQANEIRKDKKDKYNNLLDLKTKELFGVDANGKAKIPTVNAKDYLSSKSAKALESINNSPGAKAAAFTYQNDPTKTRLAQLKLLSESPEWNKLDNKTKQELTAYSNAIMKIESKKQQAKAIADKQWTKDYYSGSRKEEVKEVGYTTVPQGENSLAAMESQVINQSKTGYNYFSTTGVPLALEKDGKFLTDFKMTGLTQEAFKGQGRGRVGMITVKTPKYNDKDQITGYTEKQIPVIVTSQDPNRGVTEASYAHDYLARAKVLEQQAQSYGTDPAKQEMAQAKLNEAAIARKQGLTLVSPKMAETFAKVQKSDTFTSGAFTIDKGSGAGSVMMIDKKQDGTYGIKIKSNGNVVHEAAFPDYSSAQEYAVSLTLD